MRRENGQIFDLNLTPGYFQVRRLETELVEVNDSLKAEQNPGKESVAPKPQAETVKKVVESQLKDYCKN